MDACFQGIKSIFARLLSRNSEFLSHNLDFIIHNYISEKKVRIESYKLTIAR